MSRAPKLTPERADSIIEAIEAGNWLATAARLAGVTARTVRNWVKRGEEDSDAYPEEAVFAERFRKASADAENQLVIAIRNGAAVDPKHAEWLLQKRFPKRWGEPEKRVEISLKVRQELDVAFDRLEQNLEPEQYQRVVSIIAGALGDGATAKSSTEPPEHEE